MNSLSPALFTPLHRSLGREASRLSLEMIDAAADARVEETADLDFKLDPPAPQSLMQSDLAKDIAAMANSGGGMLVFGVRDSDSRVSEAPGVAPEFVTDTYVRDLRRVALNRVSPPILNLAVVTTTDGARHGLAVIVPPSLEVPHLIFVGDSFRAPYRVGPDTAFMSERMLERAYRERFSVRQQREEELVSQLSAALEHHIRGELWIGAIAHPVAGANYARRLGREEVARVLNAALELANSWAPRSVHPLEWLDRSNPRPGLRRWRARFGRSGQSTRWREAQAEIADDGTVLLVSAMGAGRGGVTTEFDRHEVGSDRVEAFVADFVALAHQTAVALGTNPYEVRVDFAGEPTEPIILRIPDDPTGHYLDPEFSIPIQRFVAVEAVIDALAQPAGLLEQVRDLATDVVNQGGAQYLHAIKPTVD